MKITKVFDIEVVGEIRSVLGEKKTTKKVWTQSCFKQK